MIRAYQNSDDAPAPRLSPRARAQVGQTGEGIARVVRRGRLDAVTGLRIDPRQYDDVDDALDAWRDLAGRVLVRNVFYEPDFLVPAMAHLRDGGEPLLVLIWDDAGPEPSLVLVMPVARHKRFATPSTRGWLSEHMVDGTPLVDARESARALEALCRWAERTQSATGGVCFPAIDREGPFAALLRALQQENGHFLRIYNERTRAILRRPTGPDAVFDATIEGRRAGKIRRARRKLAANAALTVRSVQDRKGVREAFEHFLALEASGWKAQRGTAMMINPALAAFGRSAVRGLAGSGQCRIDLLERDGRAIAANVVLEAGERASIWKTAYDEAHAKMSPGVQLMIETSRYQYALARIALTDSCAVQDHPMIDSLWPDRLHVADVVISTSGGTAANAQAAAAREVFRQRLRTAVKGAVNRLRGR